MCNRSVGQGRLHSFTTPAGRITELPILWTWSSFSDIFGTKSYLPRTQSLSTAGTSLFPFYKLAFHTLYFIKYFKFPNNDLMHLLKALKFIMYCTDFWSIRKGLFLWCLLQVITAVWQISHHLFCLPEFKLQRK